MFYRFLQLCTVCIIWQSFVECGDYNSRPIIGVMAQKSMKSWQKYGDTFIRSTYVKFLQMAGARVVPIRTQESDEYYADLFSKINGVLFPGGSVGIEESGYAIDGAKLYRMALKASVNGDYFPLWGTCQGFQLLSAMTSGEDLLVSCDAENISYPLLFTTDYKTSKLFKNLPEVLYEAVSKYNVTQNYHHFCLTPSTLKKNDKLRNFYHVLSENKDRKGLRFISTMEAKDHPFYGVQYHPEKSIFDWDITLAVDHHKAAIEFTQYLADFFVEETRKSNHKFPSPQAESDMLIDNYQPVYMGTPSFYTVYFFNISKPDDTLYVKLDQYGASQYAQDNTQVHNVQLHSNEIKQSHSQGTPVNGMLLLQIFVIIAVITVFALAVLFVVTRILPYSIKVVKVPAHNMHHGETEKLLQA